MRESNITLLLRASLGSWLFDGNFKLRDEVFYNTLYIEGGNSSVDPKKLEVWIADLPKREKDNPLYLFIVQTAFYMWKANLLSSFSNDISDPTVIGREFVLNLVSIVTKTAVTIEIKKGTEERKREMSILAAAVSLDIYTKIMLHDILPKYLESQSFVDSLKEIIGTIDLDSSASLEVEADLPIASSAPAMCKSVFPPILYNYI